MGRVVLVTGVSRDLGRRFARAAAGDPAVDRVIGVDVVPPRGDIGDVSFVRADIRNPVIAKVLAKEDVDTVVHMSVIATPGSAGGRNTMKELNVIGHDAAPRRLPAVARRRALRGQVDDDGLRRQLARPRDVHRGHGAQAAARARATPRTSTRSRATSAASRAAAPTSRVTTIRAANVIGPHVTSPMTSYFRLPVIPRVLGFDPRLQFLHEDDLLDVLEARDGRRRRRHLQRRRRRHDHALPGGPPPRQALLPLPGFAVGRLGSVIRQARRGRLLARAARLPDLRSWGGHHPDARDARLRAALHHRVGLRRLRRLARRPAAAAEPCALPGAVGRRPWLESDAPRPTGDAEIIPIGTRSTRSRHRQRAPVRRPPAACAGSPKARRQRSRAGRAEAGPRRRPAEPPQPTPRRGSPTPAAERGPPSPTEEPPPARPASRSATGSPPSSTARRRGLRRQLGARAWPSSWPSCAAGSPATTPSTNTASTAEITERFFMAALRPIAEKWFRVEVRGAENIPATAAPWWSPTTPARCRSTA